MLPSALKSPILIAVGIGTLALYLLGVNELLVLFGGALLVVAIEVARRFPQAAAALLLWLASKVRLMTGVTWQLGRAAIVDMPTALLAVTAAGLLFRFRLNSAWLVLAGGVVGLILFYVG